jgi:hypothetical protein
LSFISDFSIPGVIESVPDRLVVPVKDSIATQDKLPRINKPIKGKV